MNEPIPLGKLAAPGATRDAVHVAIIPMLALRPMRPGERLANGVVDPFLDAPVQPGELYYLCLYPGTVTGMKHVWQHPAFPPDAAHSTAPGEE